jgi:hypothetical protein
MTSFLQPVIASRKTKGNGKQYRETVIHQKSKDEHKNKIKKKQSFLNQFILQKHHKLIVILILIFLLPNKLSQLLSVVSVCVLFLFSLPFVFTLNAGKSL